MMWCLFKIRRNGNIYELCRRDYKNDNITTIQRRDVYESIQYIFLSPGFYSERLGSKKTLVSQVTDDDDCHDDGGGDDDDDDDDMNDWLWSTDEHKGGVLRLLAWNSVLVQYTNTSRYTVY